MRLLPFNKHPREDLSVYADGELTPQRIEPLKAHLSSCPLCRAELDALRDLKSQVSSLQVEAPRSFALTPAMASERPARQARALAPARVAALSHGMRLASGAMAVAFAVVLVLNFSGSGSDSTRGDDSARNFSSAELAATTTVGTAYDADTGAFASVPPAATDAGDAQSLETDASIPTATLVPGSLPPSGSAGIGSGPSSGGGVSAVTPNASQAAPDEGATIAAEPAVPIDSLQGEDGSVTPDTSPEKNVGDLGRTGDDFAGSEADATAGETLELAAESDDSGGGTDILTLVAIVLAAGVVLALAGSVLLPRFVRDDR